MEVACDRLLVAYLSRFQARPLFAELVKEFGCPAKTPRLEDPATLPVQRISHQKPRGISQVLPLLDYDQPCTTIAFEPDTFGKRPKRLALPVATAYCYSPETFWMRTAQPCGHLIYAPPVALPQNVARALHLTDPMFALACNEPRQLYGQHAIVKGIVSLRELPFLFQVGHHLYYYLCALLVRETMLGRVPAVCG